MGEHGMSDRNENREVIIELCSTMFEQMQKLRIQLTTSPLIQNRKNYHWTSDSPLINRKKLTTEKYKPKKRNYNKRIKRQKVLDPNKLEK